VNCVSLPKYKVCPDCATVFHRRQIYSVTVQYSPTFVSSFYWSPSSTQSGHFCQKVPILVQKNYEMLFV